jgi:hypothetical protein
VNVLELNVALVLDVGTGAVKAGLANSVVSGDDTSHTNHQCPVPPLVYPTLVSTPSSLSIAHPVHPTTLSSASTVCVGPEALAHHAVHTLHYPIQHAELIRPEYLPPLLSYTWRTLSLDPTSHPVTFHPLSLSLRNNNTLNTH